MPRHPLLLWLLLVVSLDVAALAQEKDVLVGVLEDNPGNFVADANYRDVRVIFHFTGNKWEAFPSSCSDEDCLRSITAKFPKQVNWTIAFEARELGHVEARTPEQFDSYSSIGQQKIIGNAQPPSVGQRSPMFAGFLGGSVYRPLIAVSKPQFKNPDGWRASELPRRSLAAIRGAYRKRYPVIKNCAIGDEADVTTWPYSDASIKFRRGYTSARGWLLAEMKLEGGLCDVPPDEPFEAQWFAVSPDNHVRWVGSDLVFVGAGDFDGDGRSELIFAIDGYDRGGYELFYDDFGQKVLFEFSYH